MVHFELGHEIGKWIRVWYRVAWDQAPLWAIGRIIKERASPLFPTKTLCKRTQHRSTISPNNVGWIVRDVDRWRSNDRNMLGNVAWNLYRKGMWHRYLPRSPSETMVTEHSVRTLEPYNAAQSVLMNAKCCNTPCRCWVKNLTISYFMRHCPAWCTNDGNILHPTMLGDVVPTCYIRLHGLVLGWRITEVRR